MPLHEFWHGDIRLLSCYEKAYYRNLSLSAWECGKYTFEALCKSIYNGFGRKNTSDKVEQFDIWKDPFENRGNSTNCYKDLTPQEVEQTYREDMISQSKWLFGEK
jgi:hypothetical protein